MINRNQVKTFRFVSYDYDKESGTISLRYAFDDFHIFEEKFIFNNAPTQLSAERLKALDICLKNLHIAAGISYYKAFIPEKILVETGPISKETADFFDSFYMNGLGEFCYRNQIDLQGKIHFPYEENYHDQPSNLKLKNRTAITIGGGKDSAVTIEALKNTDEDIVLVSVGQPRPIADTIKIANIPAIHITREIAPELLEWNKNAIETKALNGHVPISGIFAFLLCTAAVIYDFDKVAMSNEKSANIGNVTWSSMEINHQWSKSLDFETMVNKYFKENILSNFNYFSFLRPISEIHIAKIFARLKQYHPIFTSCNKAFKINENERLDRWCCDCDKCRFVFLILAPFINRNELTEIFGINLLNDTSQEDGFRELLGLQNFKPFECVGELEECLAAFTLLQQNKDWQNDLIIQNLSEDIEKKYGVIGDDQIQKVFAFSNEHLLSEKFKNYLLKFL